MELWIYFDTTVGVHVLETTAPSNQAELKVVQVVLPSGVPAKLAFETALIAVTQVTNFGEASHFVAVRISFS